jgi:hypothetical protein
LTDAMITENLSNRSTVAPAVNEPNPAPCKSAALPPPATVAPPSPQSPLVVKPHCAIELGDDVHGREYVVVRKSENEKCIRG